MQRRAVHVRSVEGNFFASFNYLAFFPTTWSYQYLSSESLISLLLIRALVIQSTDYHVSSALTATYKDNISIVTSSFYVAIHPDTIYILFSHFKHAFFRSHGPSGLVRPMCSNAHLTIRTPIPKTSGTIPLARTPRGMASPPTKHTIKKLRC